MLSKWITTTLGDKNYFDILGSGLILFEGIKDYLSTSSVNGLQVEYVEQEISYRRRPSRANMQPIPNSVWFAKMKNTIKVLMADTYLCKQAVLSTGFCGIHSEQVSSSYLKQIILSKEFNDQKDQFAEGSTQEAVSTSKVKLIRLSFPQSQDEQTKIAEVLSTVDRLIEQTEALIAKQQRTKIGLMQDLLTRGIDEHGNLRSEQTDRFKDSPLGRIPVEWEVKSFGEILGKSGGLLQTGPFGSQLHSYEYVSEGVPVVMPQDINSNGISTSDIARITQKKAHSLTRHRMIPGDLVFARRGDLSRCSVIGEKERGWLCGTGCLLMRPPTKVLSPKWTADTYRFYPSQLQVTARAVGSTMPNLNTSILSDINITLPSIGEQTRIESKLQAVDSDEIAIRNQLQKLRSLKTALLQDLLTGKKGVNPLLTEPQEAGA